MNPFEPLLGTTANFVLVVTKHGFPARGKIDLIGFEIPVPKPIVCTTSSQCIPLFAFSQRLHHPFV